MCLWGLRLAICLARLNPQKRLANLVWRNLENINCFEEWKAQPEKKTHIRLGQLWIEKGSNRPSPPIPTGMKGGKSNPSQSQYNLWWVFWERAIGGCKERIVREGGERERETRSVIFAFSLVADKATISCWWHQVGEKKIGFFWGKKY